VRVWERLERYLRVEHPRVFFLRLHWVLPICVVQVVVVAVLWLGWPTDLWDFVDLTGLKSTVAALSGSGIGVGVLWVRTLRLHVPRELRPGERLRLVGAAGVVLSVLFAVPTLLDDGVRARLLEVHDLPALEADHRKAEILGWGECVAPDRLDAFEAKADLLDRLARRFGRRASNEAGKLLWSERFGDCPGSTESREPSGTIEIRTSWELLLQSEPGRIPAGQTFERYVRLRADSGAVLGFLRGEPGALLTVANWPGMVVLAVLMALGGVGGQAVDPRRRSVRVAALWGPWRRVVGGLATRRSGGQLGGRRAHLLRSWFPALWSSGVHSRMWVGGLLAMLGVALVGVGIDGPAWVGANLGLVVGLGMGLGGCGALFVARWRRPVLPTSVWELALQVIVEQVVLWGPTWVAVVWFEVEGENDGYGLALAQVLATPMYLSTWMSRWSLWRGGGGVVAIVAGLVGLFYLVRDTEVGQSSGIVLVPLALGGISLVFRFVASHTLRIAALAVGGSTLLLALVTQEYIEDVPPWGLALGATGVTTLLVVGSSRWLRQAWDAPAR